MSRFAGPGAVVCSMSAMLTAGLASPAAATTTIQQVVSPAGIEAWLVEDHTIPIITLEIAWPAGAARDPDGQAGLASMAAALLDEGAGDLDSGEFQQKLADLNVRMNADARRDHFSIRLRTLSENRDDALELLRLAITSPRFDGEPVERIRGQILAHINRERNDPSTRAGRVWFSSAFGDHPYARPVDGDEESVAALTADDLKDWHRRAFTRDGIKVVAVGDLDAETLTAILDPLFGGLPERGDLAPVAEADVAAGPRTIVERIETPQTVVLFGNDAIKRDDPDFIPAFVMNYILGGGGFASRLTEEVREKRGLAYSVQSFLYPLDHAGLFLGSVATRNDTAADSIGIIRAELRRMIREGLSEEDLRNAKTHLTGAYPLRFDSGAAIARQLIAIRLDGLGADYVNRRNGLIEAVTLEDVRRAADRVLDPDAGLVVFAGDPQNVSGE